MKKVIILTLAVIALAVGGMVITTSVQANPTPVSEADKNMCTAICNRCASRCSSLECKKECDSEGETCCENAGGTPKDGLSCICY